MFVVYYIDSTHEHRRFKREWQARRYVNQMNNVQAGLINTPLGLAYTDEETYNTKVVHMVERINLRTGQKYMEPSNTPLCCSPSSETYWSM